jgi:hypothetical protein
VSPCLSNDKYCIFNQSEAVTFSEEQRKPNKIEKYHRKEGKLTFGIIMCCLPLSFISKVVL